MDVYNNEISGSERSYYENEGNCLKTANTEDKEKRAAVDQVEREVRRDN
jgi:hypothetical protein